MLRRWILVLGAIATVGGMLMGGVFYRNEITTFFREAPKSKAATRTDLLYTCAMHPQVIQEHPGRCPICGMELVPMGARLWDTRTLAIDPVMVQNMGVRTAEVRRGELMRTIRAVGTFTEPEQNHVEVNLRVSGWVEKLYADKENVSVEKGEALFDLYSPEITAAADELIAAKKFAAAKDQADDVGGRLVAAARRKLELMGLESKQIDAIEKMDKAPRTVTFYSPMTGHVTEKMVVEGSAVKAGDRVMRIADRSSMWLLLRMYEQDLAYLKVGTKVKAEVEAFPREKFEGTVEFVYPHLDMMNRTATVRVAFANHGHHLREGMYARAEVEAVAATDAVMVPREAVIDSGERKMMFVVDAAAGPGHFAATEVKVGASGYVEGMEMVEVTQGLEPGEMVVTSGQFLMDSESRRQEAMAKYMRGRLAATASAPAQAGVVDTRVDGVMKAYLDLADIFGAVGTKNAADATGLENAAHVMAETSEGEEKQLSETVRHEAAAMQGLTLDEQRAQFKAVSKAMVELAVKFGPTRAVGETLYQYHCPMTKADWIQRNPKMANPYFSDMKDCGTLAKKIVPGTAATMGGAGAK